MYWTRKHVLVCTASHCAQKGANEMIGKLRLEVIRRGLDAEILINNCGTIDLCDIGPNLVIYPDNVILSGVKANHVKQLVAYLSGDGDMSEFVTGPEAAPEMARQAFYAEAMAGEQPLSEEAFASIASSHGFERDWIDEQARRGFIARKPAPDSGEVMITVTSKAAHRYRL
jgi:(2Fe-2S) ferredoxin